MTSITFTGDIAFSKYFTGRSGDENLLSPEILSFLQESDHVVANVEGPISSGEKKGADPQAPVHVLVIPKQHICCTNAVNEENASVVADIFTAIPKIAASEGLYGGYRVITNCGEDACQTVKHLHFHILGGKKLPENMG